MKVLVEATAAMPINRGLLFLALAVTERTIEDFQRNGGIWRTTLDLNAAQEQPGSASL